MRPMRSVLTVEMLIVCLTLVPAASSRAVRAAAHAGAEAGETKAVAQDGSATAAKQAAGAQATTEGTKAKPDDTSGKSVVAVFALNGRLTEKPVAEDFPFGPTGSESIQTLIERMKKARDDATVKAVVLLMGHASFGTAQVEEIRTVMDQIKASGKEIHAHADSLRTSSLVLLAGASKLSVVPTGDIIVTGIYGEQLYVRNLLNKIGVTPDFLTCGAYKSAAETFMRSGPSPEAEQMVSWLFDGIYETYVALIAQGRGVPTEKVRSWIDHGLYTAEQAKAAGIIDAVEYRQDFVAELKTRIGRPITFDRRYGKKKRTDLDFSSPFGMLKIWADILQGPTAKRSHKAAVAVVYVDGPIVTGEPTPSPFGDEGIAYSTPIRKALDEVADDESVKAVVLRVSSPGGSATASEIILNATRRVKVKKPFAVSMGDVAGSGGYYVACGADTVFAGRSTITGSIGVVGGKLATTEMWERLGVHWQPVQRGENAALLSSTAVFTSAQRQQFQVWMDTIYEVFKGHVVAIRGSRLKEPIDDVAGGRVYTGTQALERGLIDKIGGLEEAVTFVADQAHLKEGEYVVRVVPRPKSFVEVLLSDLKDGDSDDRAISLQACARVRTPPPSLLDATLPLLGGIAPQRAAAIQRALRQLATLQVERSVLMTPEVLVED